VPALPVDVAAPDPAEPLDGGPWGLSPMLPVQLALATKKAPAQVARQLATERVRAGARSE